MIDIKELDRLARAATPGPWERDSGNDVGPDDDYYVEWEEAGPAQVHGKNANADADYLAAADPTTILSLLKELRKAKETIRMLEKSLEGAGR